jgi:hypothetical protein
MVLVALVVATLAAPTWPAAAPAPNLCDSTAITSEAVSKTCEDFCSGKCAFNVASDSGKVHTITVYRETPHNATDLAEKDCGDVYGDVSFYLANHNIKYACSLAPNASSCTGKNAVELNSQGNIFVELKIELDGAFGPYQMCNPLNGWDTKNWECLTYCEEPPNCPSWTSQKDELGWMGPTCFCENGRSNQTVGRSIRSSGGHHTNPSSWPASCGAAGYNDISSFGYELTGTKYKTLKNVDAAECCDICGKEPNGKCAGWAMKGDGKTKADCDLEMEPTEWGRIGDANITSGGKFSHSAGSISEGVLGGFWYSMPAQGECKGAARPGDGSGCTWRTVTNGKQVNSSCVSKGVDAGIIANGKACFANCADPTNVLTACWQDCFAQAVNGNTTLGLKPMPRDKVVAPFLAAFASEDPSKGGCEDLRKAKGHLHSE